MSKMLGIDDIWVLEEVFKSITTVDASNNCVVEFSTSRGAHTVQGTELNGTGE